MRLTLATVAAKNGNEVDAALEVIGTINLKGRIGTGDALHCNRRMLKAIVDKGGDDCIGLRGNQGSLLSDAKRLDPAKGSLTTKLKSAGWNHDIMLEMLGRMSQMR